MSLRCGCILILSGLALASNAGCQSAADADVLAKFQAAQEAFEAAESADDFRRVAARYQEILDGGTVSGAVLFNQGNAFMRAGLRGRAIASYRRAQRYRPRDPYLDANLRSALTGPPDPWGKPLLEYLFFWQDWLSYPAKFQLSGLAAGAAFLIATINLWLPRRWLRRLAAVVLLATLILAASASYDWYRFDRLRHGVIVAKEVVARKGDAESYQPAFNQPLSEGTEFRLLEDRGEWVLVRLAERREGWLPREAIVTF